MSGGAHGKWRRLPRAERDGSMFACHVETCPNMASHVCNAHPFDGDWCGWAFCKEHLPKEQSTGQQPGSCSPACVHLMEAAVLSARLIEAEATRDRALGLLNRWLAQHSAGGATDPCGVAAELVAESWKEVRR